MPVKQPAEHQTCWQMERQNDALTCMLLQRCGHDGLPELATGLKKILGLQLVNVRYLQCALTPITPPLGWPYDS